MSFAWPIALTGLALVALALIAYLVAQRRRKRYVVRFTNLDLLENVVADSPRWRRHIPAVLTLLALSALVVGMARPQVAVAVPREEATVILAMDSSGSMTATDVAPDRMTAAREAASSFVDGLPDGFRVGVVSFSNEADVVVPPTGGPRRSPARPERAPGRQRHRARRRDRTLGRPRCHEPRRAVGREHRRDAASSSCSSPTARTRPATTSRSRPLRRRRTPSVPVYTVALGTDAGTVEGPDGYGGIRTIRVPPDPETLSRVAELTDGKFFEAADQDALESVYDEIGSQVGVEHKQRELTVFFTAAGAALLLLGGALSTLWFGRIP